MKTSTTLSEVEIEQALREWGERVRGWEVSAVVVRPAVATIGYGAAEHQGATVTAEVVWEPRPTGESQR